MARLSKEYLIHCYSKRLMHFGHKPDTLRWSAKGRMKRYKWVTSALGISSGSTVLD